MVTHHSRKKQIKMNNSLLDLVESSPLVQAQKIIKTPNVKLYFKMEGHNPGGSNKDQAAYNMIDAAFKRGEINKDLQLIESTSGNVGITLAMIVSVFVLSIELVVSENFNKERANCVCLWSKSNPHFFRFWY